MIDDDGTIFFLCSTSHIFILIFILGSSSIFESVLSSGHASRSWYLNATKVQWQ